MRKKKYRVKSSMVLPLALAEVPLGVMAGAALGSFAGPIGALLGAFGGSVVGAVLAMGHNRQLHIEALEEERIDRELGVIGGTVGAPNLKHPPPRIGGLYHSSSLGMGHAGDEDEVVAEGPFNPPAE